MSIETKGISLDFLSEIGSFARQKSTHLSQWLPKLAIGRLTSTQGLGVVFTFATSKDVFLVNGIARFLTDGERSKYIWWTAEMIRGGKSSGGFGDNYSAFYFVGLHGSYFHKFSLGSGDVMLPEDLLSRFYSKGVEARDRKGHFPFGLVEGFVKSKLFIAREKVLTALATPEPQSPQVLEQLKARSESVAQLVPTAKEAVQAFYGGITPGNPLMYAIVGALHLNTPEGHNPVSGAFLATAIERFAAWVDNPDPAKARPDPGISQQKLDYYYHGDGEAKPGVDPSTYLMTRSESNRLQSYNLTNDMISVYLGEIDPGIFGVPDVPESTEETTDPEKTEESPPPEPPPPVAPPAQPPSGAPPPAEVVAVPPTTPPAAQSGSVWPWIAGALLLMRGL